MMEHFVQGTIDFYKELLKLFDADYEETVADV